MNIVEINITKMKSELNKLDKKIKNYEDCMNNVCYTLKQSSNYWMDGYTENFYSDLSLFSLHVDEFVEQLKSLRGIYSYIIERYEKIGSKIYFNLGKRKSVINKINTIMFDIDNAILKIDGIDATFDYGSYIKLNNKKRSLNNIKNDTRKIKKTLNNIFEEIESTESVVSRKFDSLNFDNISVKDIDEYL